MIITENVTRKPHVSGLGDCYTTICQCRYDCWIGRDEDERGWFALTVFMIGAAL